MRSTGIIALQRFVLLLLLPLAAVPQGCDQSKKSATMAPFGRPEMPGDLAAKSDGNKAAKFILLVRLRIATIEVPIGAASGSEEIWSYLDEEPIRVTRAATLGRNGLRVGTGRSDTWPDLAKILKKLTGRKVKQVTIYAMPGRPVPIVLKTRQPAQTIFISYDDRTLSGADYPPGENLLTVTFTIDEDDPSRAVITAVPQVRSTRRKTHILRGPSGYQIVQKPALHTLNPLTFQISVPNKDFLVIGPNAESRRATSVGRHFLLKKKKGVEFETMLILIPEVFATQMR